MKAVVYSRDNCQWCDRVRQLFASVDLDYIEYKLGEDFTQEQFRMEFEEAATFPQVSINNKAIGGCKETLKFLQEQQMI